MKRWIHFTLFTLVVVLSNGRTGYAQTSLDAYLEQALAGNADLQNFKLQREVSTLEIQKIKAQYESPQWSLTGDYLLAPFFFNNGQVAAITANPDARAIGYDAGVTNGGWYSGQVNVNYPIFTRGISQPLAQQQDLERMSLNVQARQLEAALKRQITADYLNAYLIQQQKDFTGQVKTGLLEQREFVRKLAGRGIMRVTGLELLNLEIQNQDFQLENLSAQFRQALITLRNDAGIADTASARLEAVELSLTDAAERSLFLEPYRLDSLNALNGQAAFEARYFPQVNLFANAGVNAVELNNIYRKVGFSAGLHVSWLFQDGGQRDINAQQNELRQLNARNQTEFSSRQIQNNRLNNGLLLQQNRQNIGLLDTQLAGYRQLLATYKQEFALGQLSVIDYLNVWRDYVGLQHQKILQEIQLLLIINEINYWNN